jgi:hypothetical protein
MKTRVVNLKWKFNKTESTNTTTHGYKLRLFNLWLVKSSDKEVLETVVKDHLIGSYNNQMEGLVNAIKIQLLSLR